MMRNANVTNPPGYRFAREVLYGMIAVPLLLVSSIGSLAMAAEKLGSAAPPATTDKPPPSSANDDSQRNQQLEPFGANLFKGNFSKTREDGLNPDYVVMPGDRVAVYVWGAVQINSVFVVDSQGNIFLPEIGPVRLAGVKNANLTAAVSRQIKRVYTKHFSVYTNLASANPVGVYVTGAVVNPGRYAGIPSDSILFFIDQAGGIQPDLGSYRHIVVIREGETVAELDLYDFILHGSLASPQFKDGDAILVKRRGPVVEIRGNVAQPARIEFSSKAIVGRQALEIVPNATRATEVTISGIREGVPYNKTMTLPEFISAPLRDGDDVTLRDDGHADSILVTIEGEFKGPAVLAVKRGARLLDVLNYIPVDMTLSNPAAAHLRRPSVAQSQKESIENSLFRLERTTLLALSDSRGEADIRVKEAELVSKFVERARLIDPLGRVVTVQGGRQMNVMLEHGDKIVIPRRTNVIEIGGEVMMSQAVIYRPGLTAEDYVEQAGGFSERADSGKVIILHADAAVEVAKASAAVRPGDQILVPPRVDSKEIQNAMDLIQIIYQIAVSAGVVLSTLPHHRRYRRRVGRSSR
jgi:protein involved in polysaccharide export with SLBB domain